MNPALVFALALLLAPALAGADDGLLRSGKDKRARGDYAEAIADLEKAGGSATALEELARAYIDVGRYLDAEQTASALAKVPGGAGPSGTLLGTVELLTGRYAAAIKRLRKTVAAAPKSWEARVRLSEALIATGTARSQLREADAIADFWQEGQVVGARDLAWLGRALHLTRYFHNANEIFEEALEADPRLAGPRLMYARLFLEKENEKEAGPLVEEALRINPNHPLALTLTARMDASSDNDPVKAFENLARALSVNPRFVPALQAKAHVLIHSERVAAAEQVLDEALQVNAKDATTLAMKASCRMLLEDDRGFEDLARRLLKVDRRFAEGFHIAAEYAVRAHRYAEAVQLEKRALKLDPEHAPSYVGLGMGYSRVGDDKRANEALQRAFELDSFNVRAFNLTEKFYDGPVKTMPWRDMAPFRVRVQESESEVLDALLPDFLKHAFTTHRERYGFTPKKPLHIEIFRDPDTFAIRSTGYPGVGVHGICFGHVVTMRSPSSGDFNWGMVLWHELAHVWHIQMSKGRVPRWFTEGLAEHETTLERPEWKREMDAQLWKAVEAKQLKGISRFNTMFTSAKTLGEIVLAYYYASKVVQFIDREWGFAVFPSMLRAWGRRESTQRVFAEVLHVSLEDFDRRMEAYLKAELLASHANAWTPKKREEADATSRLWWDAMDWAKDGKWALAAQRIDELLAGGADSVALRLKRAEIAEQLGDGHAARVSLTKALELDPQHLPTYAKLRLLLTDAGEDDALYDLLKRGSLLGEYDLGLLMTVLEQALTRKARADLMSFSERALHVAPFDPRVRMWRGRAKLAGGDANGALAELDLALKLPGGAALEALRPLREEAAAAAAASTGK